MEELKILEEIQLETVQEMKKIQTRNNAMPTEKEFVNQFEQAILSYCCLYLINKTLGIVKLPKPILKIVARELFRVDDLPVALLTLYQDLHNLTENFLMSEIPVAWDVPEASVTPSDIVELVMEDIQAQTLKNEQVTINVSHSLSLLTRNLQDIEQTQKSIRKMRSILKHLTPIYITEKRKKSLTEIRQEIYQEINKSKTIKKEGEPISVELFSILSQEAYDQFVEENTQRKYKKRRQLVLESIDD